MSIKVRNENKEFVETYNKDEIDNKVGECAKKTETYSKTEVDTKLNGKATITTGTSTPSGGSSGDMYIQYFT